LAREQPAVTEHTSPRRRGERRFPNPPEDEVPNFRHNVSRFAMRSRVLFNSDTAMTFNIDNIQDGQICGETIPNNTNVSFKISILEVAEPAERSEARIEWKAGREDRTHICETSWYEVLQLLSELAFYRVNDVTLS
jgi:hypothetical protein